MFRERLSRLFHRTWDALHMHLVSWLFSIFLVSLCFYVLGVLFCLSLAWRTSAPSWMAGDRATVFLHPQISTQAQESVTEDLKSQPEIRQISLVSKDEARRRTEALLGQWKGALEGLGDSFFPPSLEIEFQPETLRVDRVDALLSKIKQSPHVQEVLYRGGQSRSMETNTAAVKYLGWSAVAFIVATILLIFFHTSRAMVFSCRDALDIYRLAGATEFHNRVPFYLAGIGQGCLGAVLAIGLLLISSREVEGFLPPLLASAFSLEVSEEVFVSGGLLLCGIILGWAGSWLALKQSTEF